MKNSEAIAELKETLKYPFARLSPECMKLAIKALEDQEKNKGKVYAPAFIYQDMPFSDIDYEKVERALGFKLFIWQKTFIERGEYRLSGKTTALALQTLLPYNKEPLELRRPNSRREQFEQMQIIEIQQKLKAEGIPCREIKMPRKR